MTPERLKELRAIVNSGCVISSHEARELLAEIDAVTRERDAFENRIDEQNRRIAALTGDLVLTTSERDAARELNDKYYQQCLKCK